MYFQNPTIHENLSLAPGGRIEIDTYEARLTIAVRTFDPPWFTGIVERILPYEDLSQLDDFSSGCVVMGSYFPGYFWLEIYKE